MHACHCNAPVAHSLALSLTPVRAPPGVLRGRRVEGHAVQGVVLPERGAVPRDEDRLPVAQRGIHLELHPHEGSCLGHGGCASQAGRSSAAPTLSATAAAAQARIAACRLPRMPPRRRPVGVDWLWCAGGDCYARIWYLLLEPHPSRQAWAASTLRRGSVMATDLDSEEGDFRQQRGRRSNLLSPCLPPNRMHSSTPHASIIQSTELSLADNNPIFLIRGHRGGRDRWGVVPPGQPGTTAPLQIGTTQSQDAGLPACFGLLPQPWRDRRAKTTASTQGGGPSDAKAMNPPFSPVAGRAPPVIPWIMTWGCETTQCQEHARVPCVMNKSTSRRWLQCLHQALTGFLACSLYRPHFRVERPLPRRLSGLAARRTTGSRHPRGSVKVLRA